MKSRIWRLKGKEIDKKFKRANDFVLISLTIKNASLSVILSKKNFQKIAALAAFLRIFFKKKIVALATIFVKVFFFIKSLLLQRYINFVETFFFFRNRCFGDDFSKVN